ncbi:MAG: dihydroorotase [Candidatus Woesearchaeota archaeon]|nr:dihydroorotase [Candidatus Woesearchaeota archaeon]
MFIDPHVHCRDGKQAYKETIKHALAVAEKAGMTAIFDMPNIDPPVITKEHALERIQLAKDSPVFYGAYLALTGDPEEVRAGVAAVREVREIIGFKLYAGHSVGRIGVIDEEKQQLIYNTLAEEEYDGVVVVHCEKESLLTDWDPKNPISHCRARPPAAEVASVQDQINFAKAAGFKGTLHIAHVSVPEAVDLVNKENFVTCGVCPHHLLFDETAMEKENGILLKMNPPLRPPGMKEELLQQLRDGKITWIETDHAPHTLKEKANEPYMSGIPGLQIYPKFIQWLREQGIPEKQIEEITFNKIADTYKLDILPRDCEPILELGDEYEFDVYKGVI